MARRRMLVHRDYRGYTGGHGKFLDYLAHINAHPDWEAVLYLTPRSRSVPGNPFGRAAMLCDAWRPEAADALLLGGMDWAALEGKTLRPDQPIINLVQGLRHAEAGSILRGFLPRRAVRVCVSTAVASAIAATGEVNGPVTVIHAAVDVPTLARMGERPCEDRVFVDAVKQPGLGREVAARLETAGVRVDLLVQRLPRADYLARMAAAAIVVTLPEAVEGFYLPGIEALAMGRALVQCDCIGSRDYLVDGSNALVPERDAGAIVAAVQRVRADPSLRENLIDAARATARRFDLPAERRAVHDLLDRLDALWMR
ncbi:MAG: hypothetical protein OJF55_001900 [Rhodanobacteraceae bacterium]|nr:MAG: hypothetical protein OJF55_001900 [Rhodanobacteraceae bacterium]